MKDLELLPPFLLPQRSQTLPFHLGKWHLLNTSAVPCSHTLASLDRSPTFHPFSPTDNRNQRASKGDFSCQDLFVRICGVEGDDFRHLWCTRPERTEINGTKLFSKFALPLRVSAHSTAAVLRLQLLEHTLTSVVLRFGLFGEYSNLKYYRILHSKQCRMNEISRKFPEFSSSVKKGLGGEGESQTWRK